MRLRICLSTVGLFALLSIPAAASTRPPMGNERLAYWTQRVADTRAWSRFMYGTARFEPRLIVEHFTGSTTRDAAIGYWNTGPEATWVHFIIDPQGHITQLAPLDVLAKQAFGVSPWAIGVEHVGTTDADVMHNGRMRRASYRLTCWLRQRLHIPLRGVIGHGEVTSNPRFTFTPAGWRWIEETGYAFHTDFSHRTMVRYRDRLRAVCGP
ncbi:MAG TPA: N-acetylmuramoyl-L-alanine amidase [Solirubrobacterales bacterium]|jgi:N-acetyl-anhydromuramyl-L-alanine amidase AmpD